MIAKISGRIDYIGDGFLIVDVGGVGYRLFCSNRTIANAGGVGAAASFYVETLVREDCIHLFGFSDMAEKEWFNILTEVQGVGPKVGVAILSALSVSQINMALATGDSKAFTVVSGIGPKLAVRIVNELKGKNAISATAESMGLSMPCAFPSAVEEAISALSNLGYNKMDAGQIVGAVYKQNEGVGTAELIRLSLKEIGQKNG